MTFKDIEVICPKCGQETTLGVSAPDPASAAERRITISTCRKCSGSILTVTEPDGTIRLSCFDLENQPQEEITAEATIDSVFQLSDILHIPFSLWQPRGLEIEKFKIRPEMEEALRRALAEAQEKPRPLSVPRRIFISYRWGNESGSTEEDAWVEMLCQELEARGNHVVFDKKSIREKRSVFELVSRIAECHIFLAVLDSGYIERVATDQLERQEGWVTDEFETALAFANRGMVILLGILREGKWLPGPFRPFAHGQPGNTFDVRQKNALIPILDRFFIQFGHVPNEKDAALAAQALDASHKAFKASSYQNALEQANAACDLLPEMSDGFAQRARVLYKMGRPEEALTDAQRALNINPTLEEMLIYGAASACDLGRWQKAANLGRQMLERNRSHGNAHFLVGQALNELDQVEAALAHFHLAKRSKLNLPSLYNNGGYAYRRVGDPVEGLQWYERGLELEPNAIYLLANATAAAIEAGRAMKAYQYLARLSQLYPEFQDISFLTDTLVKFCQEDGPPPELSKRIQHEKVVGQVDCSHCGAHLLLEGTSKNRKNLG